MEFNNSNLFGYWFDENLQIKLPNQNPDQFKIGKYSFIASDKPDGDSMACIFKFGPFEVSCNVRNKNTSISEINIFPNPSNGTLTIHSGDDEIINLVIQDLQGHHYFINSDVNSTRINLDFNTYPNGLYLLSIQTYKGIVQKKWILNKL